MKVILVDLLKKNVYFYGACCYYVEMREGITVVKFLWKVCQHH